jgi:hypothetical protein
VPEDEVPDVHHEEAVPNSAAAACPQVTLDELHVGERVPFTEVGKAQRQATQRAVLALAADEIKPGDMLVLLRVLDLTTSYSRFADRVGRSQLAPPGMSEGAATRAVTRGCSRLANAGVIYYAPGRGRGNLTVVGLPPVGKRGHVAVPVSGAKRGQPDVPVSPDKRGHTGIEKGDGHVCAHAGAVPSKSFREVKAREEIVDDARENLISRIDEILRARLGVSWRKLNPPSDLGSMIVEVYERNERALVVTARNAKRLATRNASGLFLTLIRQTHADGCRTPDIEGGLTAAELLEKAQAAAAVESGAAVKADESVVANVFREHAERQQAAQHAEMLNRKRAWLNAGGYEHPDRDEQLAELDPEDRQRLLDQYEIEHADIGEIVDMSTRPPACSETPPPTDADRRFALEQLRALRRTLDDHDSTGEVAA